MKKYSKIVKDWGMLLVKGVVLGCLISVIVALCLL